MCDEVPDGLQVLRIIILRSQAGTLVDNEVTVVFWTELDIDIGFPERALERRLISNADFK